MCRNKEIIIPKWLFLDFYMLLFRSHFQKALCKNSWCSIIVTNGLSENGVWKLFSKETFNLIRIIVLSNLTLDKGWNTDIQKPIQICLQVFNYDQH